MLTTHCMWYNSAGHVAFPSFPIWVASHVPMNQEWNTLAQWTLHWSAVKLMTKPSYSIDFDWLNVTYSRIHFCLIHFGTFFIMPNRFPFLLVYSVQIWNNSDQWFFFFFFCSLLKVGLNYGLPVFYFKRIFTGFIFILLYLNYKLCQYLSYNLILIYH